MTLDPLNNTQLLIHEDPTVLLVLKMSQIAAKIAFHNFEWRYVTLVMFNNVNLIGLAMFLSNYRQSVMLKMGGFIPQKRVAIFQFVLFGQETSELIGMLQWIAENQYDISGKYVIICSSIDEEKCNEKDIFETLSSVSIVNVLFIKGVAGQDEPKILSYFLVSPGKCKNSEPVHINMSLGCSNNKCFESAFPEKFSNMYKCPLIVSTIEQPPFMILRNYSDEPHGGDGEILRVLVGILNATLIINVKGNDFGHYENNNWTGSLGEVFNNHAHASMCSAPLNAAKYGNFQISFTYNSKDIVWAAGLPALKPAWEKLLYPLKIWVRIIIFLMFIGIIFMNTFTKTRTWKKVIRVLKIDPPKSNLLFYAWVAFLGMPILRMPSKPSLLMIVGLWIWFTFIIRTLYQATLINVMKQRIYDDSFNAFEEVIANKNPFGGLPSWRDYYEEDKYVYNNWIQKNLVESYSTLDNMSVGDSNFVLAMNRDVVLHKLIKSKGTKHLQIIPQKIVNSPNVIFFKKFSYVAAPISRILSVSLEGGFAQRSYSQFFLKGQQLLQHSKTQRTNALRIENFKGSYIILITGWFLSILFFAVEVVCGKCINNPTHTFNL